MHSVSSFNSYDHKTIALMFMMPCASM